MLFITTKVKHLDAAQVHQFIQDFAGVFLTF